MKTSVGFNRLTEVLYLLSMNEPRRYLELRFAYLEITSAVLRSEVRVSLFTAYFRLTGEYIYVVLDDVNRNI